jgi:hypothetical protein
MPKGRKRKTNLKDTHVINTKKTKNTKSTESTESTKSTKVELLNNTRSFSSRLEAIIDGVGSSLLLPLIKIVDEYTKTDHWVMICSSPRNTEMGRHLALFDPMTNRITFNRPTIISKSPYGVESMSGRYIMDIVQHAQSGRFYFIEPPIRNFGVIDTDGKKGNVLRFEFPKMVENDASNVKDDKDENSEWLETRLTQVDQLPGNMSSPVIVTSDSLFTRVAYQYSWQRFDFSTEKWDSRIIEIPDSLKINNSRTIICGVSIGPRSFMALDISYSKLVCYTYCHDNETFQPIDFKHPYPYQITHLTSGRVRDKVIIVGKNEMIVMTIIKEKDGGQSVSVPICLPIRNTPTHIRVSSMINLKPTIITEICMMFQLNLSLFLETEGKIEQWDNVGEVPQQFDYCHTLSCVYY